MIKNDKNKQNLVILWTYEFVWIDVEVDPQSQTKLGGLYMRKELQVCQRVKCQYLQDDGYKLVEHDDILSESSEKGSIRIISGLVKL